MDKPIEFDCCECGTHVVRIVGDKAPEPPLCATCLCIPGWHQDPQLRKMLGQHLPDDVQ